VPFEAGGLKRPVRTKWDGIFQESAFRDFGKSWTSLDGAAATMGDAVWLGRAFHPPASTLPVDAFGSAGGEKHTATNDGALTGSMASAQCLSPVGGTARAKMFRAGRIQQAPRPLRLPARAANPPSRPVLLSCADEIADEKT